MELREHLLPTRLMRTRPLFAAALMLLCGCIMGYAAGSDRLMLCLAGLALLGLGIAAILLRRKRRILAALLAAAMLPLGMLHFEACWSQTTPLADQTHAALSGRICEIPEYDAEAERCICVLEDISIGSEACGRRLRLYLRGDAELLQRAELGQRISCEAHIWQPRGASNPGQFNFANHLRLRGISGYATAEVETACFGEAELRLTDAPRLLRAKLGRWIDGIFPENAALARAFLLGDRSELSQEERDDFAQSGVAHLLAISGMHISVLASAVSMALGRLMGRRQSLAVTLALLMLYGILLGFTASLSRAIIFFAVYSGGIFVGRRSDGPSRLAGALMICLLLRPDAILDAGFVLSFGASAGIILLYRPIAALLHVERLLHVRPQLDLLSLLSRLLRWAVGMCVTSLAAQLAILPAMAHYFGAIPLFSLATNLLAVPVAMAGYVVSMAESLLAGLLSLLPGLAPRAVLGDFLFGLLKDCVAFFARLPFSTLRVARFPPWLTLLCAIAMLLAAELSRVPIRVRRFLPLSTALAVALAGLCAYLPSLGCSVVFLDAGQADCAVLRAEGSIYLIDTGDSYTPAADYLSAMNYGVKGVFLSHMHDDHAGGLAAILKLCTPEKIFISANWSAYEADAAVTEAMALAQELGCEIVPLSAGDELQLSEEVSMQVLSPQAGIYAAAANDDSLVLRVEYRGSSAIFTSDASADCISGVMVDGDLLKLAHHGAAGGLSAQLLTAVTPSAAVISVGYNSYGHPAEETLELLEHVGAQVYRTDQGGAILCRFGRDGRLRLRCYGGQGS